MRCAVSRLCFFSRHSTMNAASSPKSAFSSASVAGCSALATGAGVAASAPGGATVTGVRGVRGADGFGVVASVFAADPTVFSVAGIAAS
jgi:hypothetical protein